MEAFPTTEPCLEDSACAKQGEGTASLYQPGPATLAKVSMGRRQRTIYSQDWMEWWVAPIENSGYFGEPRLL